MDRDKEEAMVLVKSNKNRIIFSIVVFVVTAIVLIANVKKPILHGDEKIYIWKSWYYSNKILQLNFSKGQVESDDPGFHPESFWAAEQPFGTHIIYSILMHAFSLEPPQAPYYYYRNIGQDDPSTTIPNRTLINLRVSASLLAAIGLSLITYRFGSAGCAAALLLLLIPHVRYDLVGAWAEGPLLFGFGLCAISYRTKWFPIACGLTAAFKLTGFGLWVFMLIPGANGEEYKYQRLMPILIAILTFVIVNPVSWVNYGPAYIGVFIRHRINTWFEQNVTAPSFGNIFFPTRYMWPFELAILLIIIISISKYKKFINQLGLT